MTIADIDAIKILQNALSKVLDVRIRPKDLDERAITCLYSAIRHLAYPDRVIYPKTRKGTKGAPIVRR